MLIKDCSQVLHHYSGGGGDGGGVVLGVEVKCRVSSHYNNKSNFHLIYCKMSISFYNIRS